MTELTEQAHTETENQQVLIPTWKQLRNMKKKKKKKKNE